MMPTPEEIANSIDQRLLQAAEEIRQLEAARHALSGTTRPRATRAPTPRAARTTKTSSAVATQPTASSRPRRSTTPTINADQLHAALGSATDGLSAADLAERTGAERPRVLTLLRQLEAAGQVRRSGERRTTRWHLISDEDRIAARAAELAARN